MVFIESSQMLYIKSILSFFLRTHEHSKVHISCMTIGCSVRFDYGILVRFKVMYWTRDEDTLCMQPQVEGTI